MIISFLCIPPQPSSSQVRSLKITLAELFKGLAEHKWQSRRIIDEEAVLMEALTNAEKDAVPDVGAIKIDSDEEYLS